MFPCRWGTYVAAECARSRAGCGRCPACGRRSHTIGPNLPATCYAFEERKAIQEYEREQEAADIEARQGKLFE